MTSGAAIYGCSGPVLSAAERRFFRQADPYGFILFARNVEGFDQLRSLTAQLRDTVGRDAPILVDQEGGRVQRLREPYWREWLPPLDDIRRMAPDAAARAMFLRYRAIGAELHAVGIDVNCAPTADIATAETHPFLSNRCFGHDSATVARAARAAADGLLDAGVLPVMKHLPGHGRAIADSHLGLPVVAASRMDLATADFQPFRALADLPMAMTAHIIYAALDADHPGTLSPAVIETIRQDIGFAGLLMTDDISMGALSGTLDDRVSQAIAAGCDVILHCNGEIAEMEMVAEAAGRLSGRAAVRGRDALAMRGKRAVDVAQAMAEYDAWVAACGTADA